MKNKIKNVIKNKITQKVLLAFCILIILIIMISEKRNISPLEEQAIKEYSSKMVINIDEIYNKEKKNDKYIVYTMKYYNNELNRNEITVNELRKFVFENFNKNLSKKELLKIGVSQKLIENNINFDYDTNKYTYNDSKTLSDIAKYKITKYELEKISKHSDTRYSVRYKKYEIKNPYKLLNYYEELNNKKKTKDKYNTDDILKYIKGIGKEKNIINNIDQEGLKKFGKEKEIVTIEYKVINNKLTVGNIKK